MRTDPRAACANTRERLGWAVLHDLVAHPLMALTGWSRVSLRLHDWTSCRAWPRAAAVDGNVYTFRHPTVDHTFVTSAASREIAQARANAWFAELEAEFGGAFALGGTK